MTTDRDDVGVAGRTVPAKPYPFRFDPATAALLVIDMQRDFVEPGGFGETLGNDVSLLQSVVPPLRRVLDAARAVGLRVIHTREGHEPDLSDCPPAKLNRGSPTLRIGDPGPKGRILVRGEYATTSSTSSRRCPASSSSTSRARARSTAPTCTTISPRQGSPAWSSRA
jgi:hypothetical protein